MASAPLQNARQHILKILSDDPGGGDDGDQNSFDGQHIIISRDPASAWLGDWGDGILKVDGNVKVHGDLDIISDTGHSLMSISDGDLTVSGSLTVEGNLTTINTTTVQVDDPVIQIAHGYNGSETRRGIEFPHPTPGSVGFMGWDGGGEF